MASLTLTGYAGEFTWRVGSLSSTFKQENYKRAGITSWQFTGNGVSSIGGIEDYENAPSNNSAYGTSVNTLSWQAGNFTFYGFTQAANGLYYSTGSATVTVENTGTGERPDNFYWSNMEIGSPMIAASEWNEFTETINKFNVYKGRSEFYFTEAYTGDTFTAGMFNEAAIQVNNLAGYSIVSYKDDGNKLIANDFYKMADALEYL